GPPRARPAGGGNGGSGGAGAPPNPFERVAASEVPLRAAKDAAGEAEPKPSYLQAARRAAQYAAQNAQRGDAVATSADPDVIGSKLAQRLKAIFVGISVAVLIVAVLRFAVSYLQLADLAPAEGPALTERSAPAVVATPNNAMAPEAGVPLVIVPPTELAAPI